MAESQILCLDNNHVNVKVTDVNAEFYYSEEQRGALAVLGAKGQQAYKEKVKTEKAKDFLSSRELRQLVEAWKTYDHHDEGGPGGHRLASAGRGIGQGARPDSLQYWPDKSDTEIPPLDLGWPESGFYRGLSRFLVYTHPPKENAPHIKAVIRQMVKEAKKVIAVVMDLFTDREVFRDVLEASYRRSVPVYMILDEDGVKFFLEMCQEMDLNSIKLRNLRVRYVSGVGFYLPSGKMPGTLSHKFLMVDGDKVAFGSFRLTWTSLRLDRNLMTVVMGQNVEMFDIEFRELYAVSEEVNLYQELNIPDSRPSPRMGARGQPEGLHRTSTVARKMINPKYALVVGGGLTPGESIRWGGSPKPPAAQGENEEDSESKKRLDKFLEDLVTVKQDNSEILPVQLAEPVGRGRTKSRNSSKLTLDLRGKDGGELPMANGAGEPKSAKGSKRFSSGFFSRKKRSTTPMAEGDFVVLSKNDADLVSLSRSTTSGIAFRGDKASGNISPTSTRSMKPKPSEKCVLS